MVQRRAGEGHEAWGSPMFDGTISWAFADFLHRQPMVFIGAGDPDGAVWSTMIAGGVGFAEATSAQSVVLHALPPPGDPLRGAFESETSIGMLSIDFARRRRIRLNGRARRAGDTLEVRTDQVLGNCPKYINRRVVVDVVSGEVRPRPENARRTALAVDECRWIQEADTFFIASRTDDLGADASHRGGPPGFVTVESPTRLSWPDYLGNSFYMTLGNVVLDDRAGLLFVRWETGDTLHLTGHCGIDWDPEHAADRPGALRVVYFEIDQVTRVDAATPLRWQALDH
ncbi:hypothetical protein CcI49_35330 [Frankia sp. CcI49]|nr:hypothetical protein ACG83_32145 [Frankia sp. R43]ONH51674.1 hypothetical protein CcI49_35330 [Frankia sp. CcI49]